MTLRTRLIPVVTAALVAAACGDEQTTPMTTEVASTTTGEPDPTTGTTTTEDPTTTTEDPTTAAPLPPTCVDLKTEATCVADPACEWAAVVRYSHGAQGCQGSLADFCVAKDGNGLLSSWYRESDKGQVVQFEYTPEGLGPEWKPCDCDGPLACQCTFNAPDCPDQRGPFCDAVGAAPACDVATINNELVCAWARIYPEGPKDDTCTDEGLKNKCIPATGAGDDGCETIALDYPNCPTPGDPVFWRENNGVLEVTSLCGPVPSGDWQPCTTPDTPEQPDECSCLCL